MNRTEHLLTVLAEEAAEIAQATSKALRFGLYEPEENIALYTGGDGRNNRQRIADEVADLVAIAEMLAEEGIGEIVAGFEDYDRIEAKKKKVLKFMEYAIDQGTLQR